MLSVVFTNYRYFVPEELGRRGASRSEFAWGGNHEILRAREGTERFQAGAGCAMFLPGCALSTSGRGRHQAVKGSTFREGQSSLANQIQPDPMFLSVIATW